MKERSQIILLVIVLLMICATPAYLMVYMKQFTFYKAELSIDGNVIEEKLYYNPNKPYHTLYRNFETPIIPEDNLNNPSRIKVLQVICSQGTPYYEDNSGQQYIMTPYHEGLLTYTENNEYGCGFGDALGFAKGGEYVIGARYELYPDTLIEYEGKHYIKFVAYGASTHPTLNSETFKVTGYSSYSKYLFPSSRSIIYIPYEPSDISDYKILHESKMHSGNNYLKLISYILMMMLPAILCIFAWRRYGVENVTGDYPEELSQYPRERKAWEVAAYFNPPFGQIGTTLIPAVMMDFYNRKIIDIKDKDKETYIKILEDDQGLQGLDELESKVMNFLKKASRYSSDKEGYFNIEKAGENSVGSTGEERLYTSYASIGDTVSSKGKEYINSKGIAMLFIGMMILIFVSAVTVGHYMAIAYVLCVIIIIIITLKTALFQKFNKEYYLEYQQWQGFKNYLSHLDSMPRTSYKGVVMWEKYLIYATSLGIGKKVLEALKKMKAIDEKQYKSYSMISSSSFISSINSGGAGSRSGSGGGSFGGGGGGGIGGGGGGGR